MIIILLTIIIYLIYKIYKISSKENFKTETCSSINRPENFGRGTSRNWKKTCIGNKCDEAAERCTAQLEKEKAEAEAGPSSSNNDTTTITLIPESITKYMSKGMIFIFVFLLMTVNLIALSISLQCNSGSGSIFYKLASALFAFMFGILYLIFNYYMYRIKVNNRPCVICRTNIFDLSHT